MQEDDNPLNVEGSVWIFDKQSGDFDQGQIMEITENNNKKQAKIRLNSGEEDLVLDYDKVERCNPVQFDKCEDMASLTYLNEPSVIHNLKLRYSDGLIYTYSGLFLVAVNPYKQLNIYNKDFIKLYQSDDKANDSDNSSASNEAAVEKPQPHIFAVSQQAFNNLISDKQDQSILVTGESGAGKTENTKRVIQHIISISSNNANGNKDLNKLESQIIQANPILESFGNAQTIKNINSSRFGKFVKININPSTKNLTNCYIDWYLLEKSRVVLQDAKERNYHIFYQFLKGAPNDIISKFKLTRSVNDYNYLKNSNQSVSGMDDTKEFQNLDKAFDIMGFSKEDKSDVYKTIAIILHLGNITFNSASSKDDTRQAMLDETKSPTDIIAKLFGISEIEFKNSFLKQKVKAGREFVVQQRNTSQAKFSIDALSKTLYERLFQFLVDKINDSFKENSSFIVSLDQEQDNFIGILDIAGFEIFDKNSFEQLCINYTNEKLQQFFNHHMFVLEQSEYLKEGISWQYIDFGHELKPTIELIEGGKSSKINVFSILNEECVVPKGTDRSFIEKLHDNLESKDRSVDTSKLRYKPNKLRDGFIIKHYAGEVDYSIDGWLDKNKDPLSNTIMELLSKSSDSFINELFTSSDLVENLTDSPVKGGKKRGIFRTVAQRHKEQLTDLMYQLSLTHPHFVRCILPNANKSPNEFNTTMVLEQLRYNGVLEGIRIARSGYPNRIEFKEFVENYGILASNTHQLQSNRKPKQLCELILEEMNLDHNVYKIGITKLFFRNGVLATLQKQKDRKLSQILTKLQSLIRGKLVRIKIDSELMKIKASKVMMKNFKVYQDLNSTDPWFKLVTQLKPMIVNADSDQSYYMQKIQKLEAEIISLNLSKSELEASNSHIKDDMKKMKDDIKVDRDLLNNKDKELVEIIKSKVLVEKSLAEIQSELDENKNELQNAKSENKTYKDQVVELKTAVESKESKIVEINTRSSKADESTSEKYSQIASELKSLKKENDELTKLNKSLKSQANQDDFQKLNAKYKQLKHESKETKELLDAKISDEIKFSKGKQQHDKDIMELKYLIKGLKQELQVEKNSNSSLRQDLKTAHAENEQLIKSKKSADVKLAGISFKLSQRPDLQSSNDIEYLQTKLASEAYENRQLKAQLKKLAGELGIESVSPSASINRSSTSSATDNDDLELERAANKRLEKLNIELQKELLQCKNHGLKARGLSPIDVDYRTKYELSKAQIKNLEDKLNAKNNNNNSNSNALKESTNQNKSFNSSRLDPFVDKDMILAKQENLRLNSLLNESQTKLKRLQLTSDATFLQQEELVQLKSKIQVTEGQNSALKNSVEFYKSRADNYYSKIEAAEVAVQSAKRSEELTREELNETKSRLTKAQKEFKLSDLTVAQLSSQIRELERDLSDKIFELKKLQEVYSSLKSKYDNEEELRSSTSSNQEKGKDKELKMLSDDLVGLMGKETELNKHIKNISLQLEVSKRETRSLKFSNTEIMKEKSQVEKLLTETMQKNEVLTTEQREHLFRLNTLKSQVQALKTSNDDLTFERDSLLESKRTLEAKIEMINEEFEKHLAKAKDDAQNAVTVVNLSKQLDDERGELSKLKSKLTSYEAKFTNYESQMEQLNSDSLMIIEENKTLTKFNAQLKAKIEDIESQYKKEKSADSEHWSSRVSELEDQLFLANSEKREEDQKLYNLERSIKELEYRNGIQVQSINRYTEEISNLEDTISRLDSNVKALNKNEAETILQLKKSEREIDSYKEKCLLLETELMDWRNNVAIAN